MQFAIDRAIASVLRRRLKDYPAVTGETIAADLIERIGS
jgi:hypothetical protein